MDKKGVFIWAWNVFWQREGITINPPELETEFRFVPGRKFKADYAIPQYRIIIEVNGGIGQNGGGHTSWKGYHRDLTKLALASSFGFYSFWFTPQMLEDDPVSCVYYIHTLIKQLDREAG